MINVDGMLRLFEILDCLSDAFQIAGIQADHQIIRFMLRIICPYHIDARHKIHFFCRWFQTDIYFDLRKIFLQISI